MLTNTRFYELLKQSNSPMEKLKCEAKCFLESEETEKYLNQYLVGKDKHLLLRQYKVVKALDIDYNMRAVCEWAYDILDNLVKSPMIEGDIYDILITLSEGFNGSLY